MSHDYTLTGKSDDDKLAIARDELQFRLTVIGQLAKQEEAIDTLKSNCDNLFGRVGTVEQKIAGSTRRTIGIGISASGAVTALAIAVVKILEALSATP